VETIAGRGLGNLHSLDHRVAAEGELEQRSGLQTCLQGADPDSETVARDLNELTQGRYGEAHGCGHAGDAFVSDHANFDGFTIFGGDEEGNQAPIGEIGELEFLRGLVEDGALRELDCFQMRKNEAVF